MDVGKTRELTSLSRRSVARVIFTIGIWTMFALGRPAALGIGLAVVAPARAWAFSFHEEEEKAERPRSEHQGQRRSAPSDGLSAACRTRIAQRRTMVVIAERIDTGGYRTAQSAYGPHLQALGRRLHELGVKTFTPEEIRAQIAQAEIDAYFRNDPDAALAASRKLGADLVLRGVISSRSTFNHFMGLPEVAVTIGLTLVDSAGHVVSDAAASADSYAGYDTLGMALRLVDERAPAVITKLYRDYCRQAAPTDDTP